jgi:hypothetical protein
MPDVGLARSWMLVFPIRDGSIRRRSELRLSCSDPSRVRTIDIRLVSHSLVPCVEEKLNDLYGVAGQTVVEDAMSPLGMSDEALVG